ncbi:helix-turn-helix domain-containing protein [Nocardioides sediminis]|uniref:helix-turn-helix domain-containing protein n=1 Tax=Nocardioides sediminis TaxID=433648 RepID=UPI000D309945|nr:helix-turn-helix domain-containing protein [Nocardioides sediminis]
MGAAELYDADGASQGAGEGTGESLSVAPDVVEVRRNGALAAAVGAVAAAVAIAYLARAAQSGAVLDWVLAAVLGLVSVGWLRAFVDARTPLLVADAQGVRIRLGHTWRGLPWSAVHHVEHSPRRGLLRDGRLVVVAHNEELVLDELDARGRRQAGLSQRMYGGPLAVPLGLSTRVLGAGDDLTVALDRVAMRSAEVVVLDASTDEVHDEVGEDATGDDRVEDGVDASEHPTLVRDPRPLLAAGIARLAALVPSRSERTEDVGDGQDPEGLDDPGLEPGADDTDVPADEPEPVVASATPSPLREAASARRSEVRRDLDRVDESEPAGRELRRPGSVSLVEDTQAWGDRVRPIARQGDVVEPLVIDEFATVPAADPVVGPELAAARTRLGLTVDQLAERTRIRPHVIESIEVDDFAPCGGDFYARGHLRTLARVLGIDVAPLLTSYDERYAHAPINPRRVFEAELATGANGSIRSTRGGPNWSVLVAVVMALVLCWSIARLVMDTPTELRNASPVLNGSGGPGGAGAAATADPVPVVVTAATGGAHVVVRDGAGEIVFKGNLAVGDVRELDAAPPVRVQSTDGAVTVALDGQDPRPVGDPGIAGQGTFVPR